MKVAFEIARRSVCVRSQVGAVIVSPDQRHVSTGYNGQPSGLPPWESCVDWCPRAKKPEAELAKDYTDCHSVHAEMNALMHSDRTLRKDGSLYVTSVCCWNCGKAIANSGIAKVVMINDKRDSHRDPEKTIEFMRSCGLTVTAYVR
jgi:dCMP deaminase